jgi:hypothetical protein
LCLEPGTTPSGNDIPDFTRNVISLDYGH